MNATKEKAEHPYKKAVPAAAAVVGNCAPPVKPGGYRPNSSHGQPPGMGAENSIRAPVRG